MTDTTLKLILLGEDKSASKALGAVGIGAAVAGAALLKFGSDSVSAYVAAEKQQAKLEDAFQRFPKLADTNVAALNSINEAIERKGHADADDLAAAQATMAQYDLTGKQLERITPLLVDYANKTGKDMPTAAGMLGKALMGNARAMKDLGIDFKVTGDRAADFDTLVGDLDEKVGGYSDNLPKVEQKQRALGYAFENLQEDIGEKLLPVVISLMDTGQGLIDWASDNQAVLIPVGKAAMVAAGAIGAVTVASKAVQGVKGMTGTVKALGDAYTGMSTKAKVATISMGAVGVALTVGAALWAAYEGKNAEAQARVEDFTAAIKADTGALGENTRASVVNRLETEGLLKSGQRMGVDLETLTDAVMGNAAAMDHVREKTSEYLRMNSDNEGAITGAKTEVDQLTTAIAGQNASLNDAVESYRRTKTATGESTTATQDNTTAVQDNVEAQKDLLETLRDVWSDQLDAQADNRALEASYDNAKKSAKDYRNELIKKYKDQGKSKEAAEKAADADIKAGKALDANTDAGRRNEEKLGDIIKQMTNRVAGMVEMKASEEEIEAVMKRSEKQYREAAAAMGANKEKADELSDAIREIKSKRVDVEVNVRKTGINGINAVYTSGGGVRFRAVANGGRVSSDGWYIAGEQGIEAIRLPTGSTVYPATSKESRSVGGGGSPTPITVLFPSDPLGEGRRLYNLLREYNDATGGRGLTFK